MIAMLVGTVLALAALAYVLYPLLREFGSAAIPGVPATDSVAPDRATAVDALREVEFDYATGKLSERDYRQLKSTYTVQAAAELRGRDAVERVCPTCGARPEPDAQFCSSCGVRLVS